MLDDSTIARYLDRLSVDRQPPSADALQVLQQAHRRHVPWELTWIHLGERWSIDQNESVERIVDHSRGGYCYHLNGAFALLLMSLGYDVTLHSGGVHGADGPNPAVMDNHLVLVVHGLPSDDNPTGRWYVDVGLGDTTHDRLPLVPGTYSKGAFTYELVDTAGEVGDWLFRHDPLGSFVGMSFWAEPTSIESFAARHAILSTSPLSPFMKFVVVQRVDRDGADILRGIELTRVDGDGRSAPRVLASKDEWLGVLADTFSLPLDDVDATARDELWKREVARYEDRGRAAQT